MDGVGMGGTHPNSFDEQIFRSERQGETVFNKLFSALLRIERQSMIQKTLPDSPPTLASPETEASGEQWMGRYRNNDSGKVTVMPTWH